MHHRPVTFWILVLGAALIAAPQLLGQTSDPGDLLTPGRGETGWQGKVQRVDRRRKTISLLADSVLGGSDRPRPLLKKVPRVARIDSKTYFRVRNDATRRASFTDVRPGMIVTVVGRDLGSGRGIQAREVGVVGVLASNRKPNLRANDTPSRLLTVNPRWLSFRKGSTILAVLEQQGRLRLWNTKTGEAAPFPSEPGAPGGVDPSRNARRFAVFSPEGRWLAVDGRVAQPGSGDQGVAHILNALSWDRIATLGGHKGEIQAVDFSPEGNRFATGGIDGTIRVWDTGTWQVAKVLYPGSAVAALSLSPEGKLVAVRNADGIRIWSTESEQSIQDIHLAGSGFAFSPGGEVLAVTGTGSGVTLLDTTGWKTIRTLNSSRRRISLVRFAPNGKWIAGATADNRSLFVWEAASGKLTHILQGQPPMEFSADSKMIACRVGSMLRLWSLSR